MAPTDRPRRRSRPLGARAYPGSVRIIGGRWRSRRVPVLSAEGLRPTPDRVRETLFNWLAPCIEGAHCLDLFAGTGALCLEALSRGAARVVMVEHSRPAADQLRANVARLGAVGAEVRGIDALEYLAGRPEPFDVIFLDPPFARAPELIETCAQRIDRHGWLRARGFVYIEAPRSLTPLPVPTAWRAHRAGQAGQVSYHLLQAAAGDDQGVAILNK